MRLTYPHALSTVSKLLMVCFQFPDLQCELTDEDHWTLEAGLYKENQRLTPAEEKSSWETGPTQGGGKHKTTKTLRAIRDVVSLKREQELHKGTFSDQERTREVRAERETLTISLASDWKAS